jgi:hypothetical protein
LPRADIEGKEQLKLRSIRFSLIDFVHERRFVAAGPPSNRERALEFGHDAEFPAHAAGGGSFQEQNDF